MKKYTSLVLAILFYTCSVSQPAHAQLTTFCVNCSESVTQWASFAKDVINTSANVMSQADSYFDRINKYILDPLANNMLAAVQIQKQLQTLNFITAIFGNEGALLIQNPEQWIKNKGKAQVQIALGSIQQQNGLYKDSLLASVISTYKSADDLNKTIQDLSKSNIPNAVQKNICNDSSLTNLAKNDVMQSNGSYDPALLQRRKAELHTTLCTSNPLTNADLARTLTKINQQIPSIGGWDVWLLSTGGDNQYAHSGQINLAISKRVEQTVQAKKDELNRNGGIANKTECSKRAFPINDDDGNAMPSANDTSLPCVIEEITQTGNALNSQFQEALNAPLRKLQASFGTGIFRSISAIMSIMGSAQQLSTAFNSGSGRGSSESGSSAQVTYTPDLADPARQTQATDTIREPLNRHLKSLADLEKTENEFQGTLSSYESTIVGLKQCYDDVVKTHENAANDYRTTSAYAFITQRLSVITSQKDTSVKNLSKIGETRNLISDTLASISKSQSSEEMTSLFSSYQKKVDTLGLPDYSAAAERQSDLINFRSEIQQEAGRTGTLPVHTSNCSTVRAQYGGGAGETGV